MAPCRSGFTRECDGASTTAFAGKPAPTRACVLLNGYIKILKQYF
ncbi:hypothetical protein PRJ_5209 [Pseudomonas sp. XWY-1]|nr:hypothetical protein PRJ_5209 [Pseudomonas sp. XWY-1]